MRSPLEALFTHHYCLLLGVLLLHAISSCLHCTAHPLLLLYPQVTLFLLEEHNTVISIQKTPSEINSLLLGRIM